MAKLSRGEIWWTALPLPAGRRPTLILTRDSILDHRSNITVAPISRTRRGIPSEVELNQADGVPSDCAVSLDSILTIPKIYLQRKITTLAAAKMSEICRAIHFALDLPF